MTRETRIALVVGLAFIVLFGMVLGQRSLNLSSPLVASGAPAPVRTSLPPAKVGPEINQAFLTEDYEEASVLAPPRLPLPGRPTVVPTGGLGTGGAVGGSGPEIASSGHGDGRMAGEDTRTTATPRPPTTSRPTTTSRPSSAPGKLHTVAQGETLAKIARIEYGSDKDWQRIFEANKEKLKTPSAMLKIGMTLTVPPPREATLATTPPAAPPVAPPPMVVPPPVLAPTTRPAGTGTAVTPAPPPRPATPDLPGDMARTYVVKPGDSLAMIARRVMGDGQAAVRRLVAVNKIEDPNRLKVGQTLKIPS